MSSLSPDFPAGARGLYPLARACRIRPARRPPAADVDYHPIVRSPRRRIRRAPSQGIKTETSGRKFQPEIPERAHAVDTVSAAELAIVVDDPVARCARPAPSPSPPSRPGEADVIIGRTARAPSSPQTEITKMESANVGQQPLHRAGGPSRSSRVGIAQPSLARA